VYVKNQKHRTLDVPTIQRMDDSFISEYIDVATLLGSYGELVQGSGGNISVKNDTTLCIKSSGKRLAETSQGVGYTLCSLTTLRECASATVPAEAILEGGELNSQPSMEVWFHLLPSKWCIHLHPTFLLGKLCQDTWREIHSQYSHTHVQYATPGYDLAREIKKVYRGEQIVFLQHHGILICTETAEEAYTILETMYKEYAPSNYPPLQIHTFAKLRSYLQTEMKCRIYSRECQTIRQFNERMILPITPDCSLFLKQVPLVQETKDENIETIWATYLSRVQTTPAVVCLRGRVFTVGRSFTQCLYIEELLLQYIEICKNTDTNTLQYFTQRSITQLVQSPQEKYRLGLLESK
jgi:rhamnose utilization protein RhaD (predicted bifunctional aldolase and dehydrogenase)